MTQSLSFGTIQFRNGVYQGFKSQTQPQGVGIFMSDDLSLHFSTWRGTNLSNHTAIFISHAKYVYGIWNNGVPHGMNVYRSGDIVLLGNFDNGKIVGEFIVIFQRQNFMIAAYHSQQGIFVSEKRQFTNQSQLKKVINTVFDNINLQDDYFSFVKYLNTNFCQQDEYKIKINLDQDSYRFGYQNGLSVVFDDDNYIHKLGYIDHQDQMSGLGILFSKITQAGNFANGLIIKCKSNQIATEEIKKLFKNQHKRSIYFLNDFMFNKTPEVIHYLEGILRTVIKNISQNPIDTQRSITKQQLDQSLQYRARPYKLSQQNQRLKLIRQQLHRSIGLPINIKQTPLDSKKLNKIPDDIKQLHFTRSNNNDYFQPESISFSKANGKTFTDNRKSFLQDNKLDDYRNNKIKMQNDIGDKMMKSQKSNKSIFTEERKSIKSNKYEIEKSPSKQNIYKQSQMSTAHKNKDTDFKPIVNDRIKDSQKRSSFKQQQPLNDSLESPYRKYLFNDSIRQSNNNKNNSRQYIPISHNNNPKIKSPQKRKQFKQIPRQFKQLDKPTKSYLALYKNSSPPKIVQRQAQRTKSTFSPLKNPYYQRDQVQHVPTVYTKQPIRSSGSSSKHPYLRKSRQRQIQRPRQSPEKRIKMLDNINKKYNYVYDNL